MEETVQKPSRWWRIVLPVSLVLNLFFIAVIGGHVLRVHRGEEAFGTPLGRALAHAEASLPPQDAAAFGAAIKHGAPRYGQDLRDLADARQALNRQVTAETFDRDATRQALTGWETAWGHFVDDFADTFVDALAGISPEGRRKLVSEFRASHPPRVKGSVSGG
jgi:uncharacterized membrane protein